MIEGLKKGMKPTGKKSLHGKFPKSIADFADSVLWQQLRSGYVKKNTEAVIKAAQDQPLRTNWIKANIYGVDCPPPYVDYASLQMNQPCTLQVDANSQQSNTI